VGASGSAVLRVCARWVWTLGVLLVAMLAASCAERVERPKAVRGLLDLSAYRLADGASLPIEGEWEFYWQEQLTPRELAARGAPPASFIDTGSWAGQVVGGQELPQNGYATYRLRLRLPEHTRLIGLRVDAIHSASTIYVDGKLVFQNGQVGSSPAKARILHRQRIIDHVPQGDTVELVIAASNYDYTYPGVMGVTVGLPSELHRLRETGLSQSVLLLGGMLLMLLYHVGLYALRPGDRSPLYFALMCSATGLFNLVNAGELAFYVLPRLDGELWWKLYFLGWFGGVIGYQLFLMSVLPGEFDRRLYKPMSIFTLVCTAFVLALPFRIFHVPVARAYQLYSLLAVSHCIYVLVLGIRRRREGARILLTGTLGLFALFLHDLLLAEQLIKSTYLTPLGLFFVLFAQSILLAARFSKAFSLVEASERARTQFFHNTSHELRTPLNGILGFVDLLRRGHYGNLGQSARVALDKVAHLTESLRGQVNTILDLAKSKQGKLDLSCSRVSLNDVVHELRALADGLSLSSSELHFECHLSWDIETESPQFVSDKDKLLTILRNLLGNAFKFRERGKPHRVALRMKLVDGLLELEVEDSGIGIPRDQQSRIFEEFVQVEAHASRAFEGTGLGLAMVKSCVSLLGGTLTLDSEPGRGTRMHVRIPEQQGQEVLQPKKRTTGNFGVAQEHKNPALAESGAIMLSSELAASEILVVDDNLTNLEVMRELLRSAGYPVVTCSGGREGLERIREQPPDLLLLDLMMPDVSGEDVLKAIRSDASLADMPVVLLTARASQEDRLLGLRLGADDYLAKPVDSGELLLRVRNSLGRAHLSREKVQRDQNLEAARAVQQALLPVERNFPNVFIEDYYQAAEQTGGDWFGYAYDERRSRLYVAIGDVTGHGVPAALVTGAAAGAFKASFTILRNHELTSEATLSLLAQGVHEAVRETGRRTDRMMTMTFVCLDARTGHACYINAGHNPFYLFGKDESRPLIQQGNALGSEDMPEFAVQSFRLRRGESMFLYTDGLTENAGPDGKTLSPRRLQKLLDGAAKSRSLKPALLSAIKDLWKDELPPDDCSFVVVRWQPVEEAQVRASSG
jgi:signal transduction histidine kinase/serine phosphatase RsbU (regulator of sigma subunit)